MPDNAYLTFVSNFKARGLYLTRPKNKYLDYNFEDKVKFDVINYHTFREPTRP